jgi:hypothetical protein
MSALVGKYRKKLALEISATLRNLINRGVFVSLLAEQLQGDSLDRQLGLFLFRSRKPPAGLVSSPGILTLISQNRSLIGLLSIISLHCAAIYS